MLDTVSSTPEQLSVEELTRFFNVLAHDLKSPIFSIDGFSDLLLADYAGKIDEEGEDFLRRIRSSAQQMKKVIDDMCHIVKLLGRQPEKRTVDLAELVEELRLKYNYLLDECGAELEVDLSVGEIETDPDMLKEALGTLLKNAIFFNDRPKGERAVKVEVKAVAEGTSFSIRDNGIGIDPRYVDQVFELGIKLDKSRGGGPGYGLYMARKIVAMLGGEIKVDTALGEGATFRFVLP